MKYIEGNVPKLYVDLLCQGPAKLPAGNTDPLDNSSHATGDKGVNLESIFVIARVRKSDIFQIAHYMVASRQAVPKGNFENLGTCSLKKNSLPVTKLKSLSPMRAGCQ